MSELLKWKFNRHKNHFGQIVGASMNIDDSGDFVRLSDYNKLEAGADMLLERNRELVMQLKEADEKYVKIVDLVDAVEDMQNFFNKTLEKLKG